MDFLGLSQMCAPSVAPSVSASLVKVESGFNPYTIGVNRGAGRLQHQPQDLETAVVTAQSLLDRGLNIDLGLAQINSANLSKVGLSVRDVFDPCKNLGAMQKILGDCYLRAGGESQSNSLPRALSCYNTGNLTSGFANGYVNKVSQHISSYAYAFNGVYQAPVAVEQYAIKPVFHHTKKAVLPAFIVQVEPVKQDAVNDSLPDVFSSQQPDAFSASNNLNQ
jgi:type IV secretion system protein VirB1